MFVCVRAYVGVSHCRSCPRLMPHVAKRQRPVSGDDTRILSYPAGFTGKDGRPAIGMRSTSVRTQKVGLVRGRGPPLPLSKLCGALLAPAWEGRQGAQAALVSRGGHAEGSLLKRQTNATPGSTNRHPHSALMAQPPSRRAVLLFINSAVSCGPSVTESCSCLFREEPPRRRASPQECLRTSESSPSEPSPATIEASPWPRTLHPAVSTSKTCGP